MCVGCVLELKCVLCVVCIVVCVGCVLELKCVLCVVCSVCGMCT